MTAPDDLLEYIFDGKNPTLYPEVGGWVRDSRRFRTFVGTYRDKIRAKLRNVRDEGGTEDLRVELQTAVLLLREERFTLEYERYAAFKQRGPDFTVTFRTNTPFNIEVRRIRGVGSGDGDTEARVVKLMAVVCEKVEQMPPSIVNLLWLIAERGTPGSDLTRAATTLRQLAERKAEEFFTGRGFESAADFLKHYRRLSGIVLRQSGEIGQNVLWLNSLARHRVPPALLTAIQRLETT